MRKTVLLAIFPMVAGLPIKAGAQEGAGQQLQFVMPGGAGGANHFGVPGAQPYAEPYARITRPEIFMASGHSCKTPAGYCRDETGSRVGGACFCLDDHNTVISGVMELP